MLLSAVGLVGLFGATSPAASAADRGTCKLTGGGVTDDGASFTISAQSQRGVNRGRIVVVTPNGDELVGTIMTLLECRKDGGGGPGAPHGNQNVGEAEGPATVNGVAGYEFSAVIWDHGEGRPTDRLADSFGIVVAPSGGNSILYRVGGLVVSGNIQVHPAS